MPGDLRGVRAKLSRADAHIEDINRRIVSFSVKPYEVVPYFDNQTGEDQLRLHNVKEIPDFWATIIGDAINNLRSSLDHLMWNLVLLNNEVPDRHTQFPIVSNGNGYDGNTQANTAGASAVHIADIKALQPYHRVGGPEADPLFWLRELSNFDKHRLLLLTDIAVTSGGLGLTAMRGIDLHIISVHKPEAKNGAILARFKVVKREPGGKVNMKPVVPCEIQFAPACPACIAGKPVVDILRTIRDHVHDFVLAKFIGAL